MEKRVPIDFGLIGLGIVEKRVPIDFGRRRAGAEHRFFVGVGIAPAGGAASEEGREIHDCSPLRLVNSWPERLSISVVPTVVTPCVTLCGCSPAITSSHWR